MGENSEARITLDSTDKDSKLRAPEGAKGGTFLKETKKLRDVKARGENGQGIEIVAVN
jgi:hypothetical protein